MFIRKKADSQLQVELAMELGEGPMRFGPVRQECSVRKEAQRHNLSEESIYAFADVKAEWEIVRKREAMKKRFTDEQILRIVMFCSFDAKRSLTLMRRTDPRHFNLSASDLKLQLETKTLFPCPGLKTSKGSSVFYMRPSRYSPKETPVSLIIDNLVYVMDKMSLQQETKSIAFVANMEGWTMSNFSYDYCRKFMNVLQGRNFPAKVDLFLILNPPAWFGKVWAIMKPMLSTSFRKKVFMINDDELPFFMMLDYEKFLPDDAWDGQELTLFVTLSCFIKHWKEKRHRGSQICCRELYQLELFCDRTLEAGTRYIAVFSHLGDVFIRLTKGHCRTQQRIHSQRGPSQDCLPSHFRNEKLTSCTTAKVNLHHTVGAVAPPFIVRPCLNLQAKQSAFAYANEACNVTQNNNRG